jgi:hypothetical protein
VLVHVHPATFHLGRNPGAQPDHVRVIGSEAVGNLAQARELVRIQLGHRRCLGFGVTRHQRLVPIYRFFVGLGFGAASVTRSGHDLRPHRFTVSARTLCGPDELATTLTTGRFLGCGRDGSCTRRLARRTLVSLVGHKGITFSVVACKL